MSTLRIWSGELELTDPKVMSEPLLGRDGVAFDEARLLIRVLGDPVGFTQAPLTAGRLDLGSVLDIVERELAHAVDRRLSADGLPSLVELRRSRAATGRSGPASHAGPDAALVTVIVCSRNRAAELRGCLQSLQRLRHPNLDLLVVDNAPTDDSTERLVGSLAASDSRLRYVREDRPGLSVARNRGLSMARGQFVAYTDDDVRVDPLWVRGLLAGFGRREDVACVTGLVASASLERPAEQYFDARVWWSSSCEHRLYAAAPSPRDSRFHPYASGLFGTGANIAFRAAVLREIGGFDESLGAGSPSAGGEDLDSFVRVLRSGFALSYEPAALVWHEHRVDDASLQAQMYAYGKGLSAYLCKYVVSRGSARDLAGRMLAGLWHGLALANRSRGAAQSTGVARGLMRAELRGLLAGPTAYLRARAHQNPDHVRAVAP